MAGRSRSPEPLVWLLFSGGGVLAALFAPVLLFLFGLAFPLGWIDPPGHQDLLDLIGNPLVRIGLFVLCAMCLVHAAHRFRYTLYDGLQIQHLNELVALLCYGGAALGTVVAAVFLLQLP
jgi:fumarate reductase subunit D